MLWDKLTEENYVVYINRDIDLKIKVFELMENDEIYIKYKGFNLTIPMLVWEFGEDLKLASIEIFMQKLRKSTKNVQHRMQSWGQT